MKFRGCSSACFMHHILKANKTKQKAVVALKAAYRTRWSVGQTQIPLCGMSESVCVCCGVVTQIQEDERIALGGEEVKSLKLF